MTPGVLLCCALLLAIRSVPLAHATEDAERLKHRLVAACVCKFPKYVRWPEREDSKDEPFVIGVLGTSPITALLEEATQELQVGGRDVTLTTFDGTEVSDALYDCHVLFVAQKAANNQEALFEKLAGRSVLTVSLIEDFAKGGGIIEIGERENKLQFKINLGAAKANNISISSQLLKLSTVVSAE